MSAHEVRLNWQRGEAAFKYDSYPREHQLTFGGGLEITASAAHEYRGKPQYPNPEEALVFAIASCHMLTFLAVAAKRKLSLLSYRDHALGKLEKNADGYLAVTHVTLRPELIWEGEAPARETLERMHEASHRECFIANSVNTRIDVEF
jgi:organic hydroperoxide reductase OsmC/OhrA